MARFEQAHGVLVLDKPSGPTSAACLNRIKREAGQKKIGHAGTLDPLAQGVLVVLLGSATKIAPFVTGGEKVYSGRFRLGLTTDTYDIQGEVVRQADASGLDPEEVKKAVLDWESVTVQEVPAYSAAKHKGKPLYRLAREGREVPVKTKEITVSKADCTAVELPEAAFRVSCSAGTYIRSLVHSLGMRIGCGAVLTQLTREASRPFGLESAHDLDGILAAPETLGEKVLPIAEALADWPRAVLSDDEAAKVKNGVRLPVDGQANPGARALFTDASGRALALAEAVEDGDETRWALLRGLW